MEDTSHKLSRAFSLIELLLVIVIIALIASLLVGAGSKLVSGGKDRRTKGVLLALAGITTEYEAQTGSKVNENGIEDFVRWVKQVPTTKRLLNSISVENYIEDRTVVDAWGKEIRYVHCNHYDQQEAAVGLCESSTELPAYRFPFFASAGADGEWGNVETYTDDDPGNDSPKAFEKDNLYSIEIE